MRNIDVEWIQYTYTDRQKHLQSQISRTFSGPLTYHYDKLERFNSTQYDISLFTFVLLKGCILK
jgi:hypothetical protein